MSARRSVGLAVLLSFLAAPLWAQPPAGVIEYYHVDALGSVRAVTNASGGTVRTHHYHPFGEGVGVDATTDPMRFTGKPRDGETGLDYLGARYYAPKTARFATVDPVFTTKQALVDPQRWNRYAYSRQNPYRYLDPNGEWLVLVQWAQRLSPYSDRAMRAIRQSYVWATRFFNSSTGQAVVETAAETLSGAQLGPLSSQPIASGSVLLGEAGKRFDAVSTFFGSTIFAPGKVTAANFDAVMSANMSWLRGQLARGATILDIGTDLDRKDRGVFYKEEVSLLRSLGYAQREIGTLELDGKLVKVYQWVKVF